MVSRRRGLYPDGSEVVAFTYTTAPQRQAAPSSVALSGTELLRVQGVDVSYGQLQVLFDVDFGVGEGEIVTLLGTNGAGKSTLLKAIVGLVPFEGAVGVGDRNMANTRPETMVREGVALMSGGKSVFPTLTVDEHLWLATWTFRRDADRIREDTASMLEMFPAIERRRDIAAGDLSGGEQQQLALAQTLLLRPKVLLIDELSLGLAPTVVGRLLEVVRALNASGTTVVVVEQSVNVALALADRAAFMEKGQVRFEGSTRELLDRPDLLRSVFIEGAGSVAGNGVSLPEEQSSSTVDLSSLAKSGISSGTNGSTGPVLECRGVTKHFGGVVAVNGVDLTVSKGEIVGLVGQNGAGKTTLVDCISGFHDLDDGIIEFRGRVVTDWEPWERARARLGRSFQEARLFPSLTVAETISVACERHVASRAIVGDAFRQPASFESERAVTARVEMLVDLLALGDHSAKLTSDLSTGMRRIVELACLLAEDPVLMLLDEPSAGVAQRETEALGPLLRRIRDQTGAAMLIIEHDMPLLSGVCDQLVALELGAVMTTGSPEEVLADERVIAAYLGTDAAAINRSDHRSVAEPQPVD